MAHMRPKLKRSRSAASADHPEQTHPSADGTSAVAADLAGDTSELLVQSLAAGRTSADALAAVLGELNALPHVPMDAASTARDMQINHLLCLDMLHEAVLKARAKANAAWTRTPWQVHSGGNILVLDGQDDEDGNPYTDGCGICGVPKTECMKQDEHFGARGESPPDSTCKYCRMNFWNRFNSGRELQLHIAAKHAANSN